MSPYHRATIDDERIDQVLHDFPQSIERCGSPLLGMLRHDETQSLFDRRDATLVNSNHVEDDLAEV
jgi:hypothetical protein